MKSESILDAIGMINEEAVREAKAYQRPKSRGWVKWGAMAACLCLVVLAAIPFLQNREPVTDIEPYKELTVVEAVALEPYGELYPQTILEGYTLEENKVGFYDGKVLKAVYCNNSTEDIMTIIISDKEYFEDVELNIVLEKGESGSKIYLNSRDYIVCYSFSTIDINTIDGFSEMVSSARSFQ